MGTPFIITIIAVIVVCITIAIIVVGMMRANSSLGIEEPEAVETPSLPVDNPEQQNHTGPLPPFLPLLHQTQPLSEIYYYDDRLPGSQPSAPLPPITPSSAQPMPPEAPVPPVQPPTGPLPSHYNQ